MSESRLHEFYEANKAKCPLMVHAYKHMTAQQLSDFEEALQKPWQRGAPEYLKHAIIADIVNKWDIPNMPKLTGDAVGKHRRKVCSCE